jgi:DNA-binding transcriptional ArsR family regulator
MVYRPGVAEPAPDAQLDAVFGALAHPARRELLRRLLAAREPQPMGAVAAAAGVSPQLLTKHVATLERAGLITRTRHGREKHAHAHPEPLTAATRWIEDTAAFWNAQLDALQDYVAGLQTGAHRSTED